MNNRTERFKIEWKKDDLVCVAVTDITLLNICSYVVREEEER
jgi:hypothetical protein